jgi:hypothetical protein
VNFCRIVVVEELEFVVEDVDVDEKKDFLDDSLGFKTVCILVCRTDDDDDHIEVVIVVVKNDEETFDVRR